MGPRSLGVIVGAMLVPSCVFGGDPNLNAEGKSVPKLELEFPSSVEAGSTATAALTVTNPGPQDMPVIRVSFALVGTTPPLVGIGAGGGNESIVSIDPQPTAVTSDGVIYSFKGLASEESMVIAFTVEIPERRGTVANSVQVFDGQDPRRATGVRLETRIEG